MAARLLEHLWAPSSKILSAISLPGLSHLHVACMVLGPGVDSASNRNGVPGVFPGGKGGRCLWKVTGQEYINVEIRKKKI